MNVGDCFWTVSIVKFILRCSYQLYAIIMIHNNSCNWVNSHTAILRTNEQSHTNLNGKLCESQNKHWDATKNKKKCGPSESSRIEDEKFIYYFSFWYYFWMKWGQCHTFFHHLFRFRFGLRYFINAAIMTWSQKRRNKRVFRRKQSNSLSIILRIGERYSQLATSSHFALRFRIRLFFGFRVLPIILTRKCIMTKWHKHRDEESSLRTHAVFPQHGIKGAHRQPHEKDSWTFW